MKKLLLLALLCNIVMAPRPPHEITVITRPVSPLMSDLELNIRVSQLIKERRNCLVRSEDSTLIAILEVIKNAYALAASMPENPTRTMDDWDIRRAIKYLEPESGKTKIL